MNFERRMAAPKWIETGEVDKKGEPIRKPNPVHLDAGAGRAILDSIRWRLARMAPDLFAERRG